jgi:hypothetical protein
LWRVIIFNQLSVRHYIGASSTGFSKIACEINQVRLRQKAPWLCLERRPPARRVGNTTVSSRAGGRRSEFCRGH